MSTHTFNPKALGLAAGCTLALGLIVMSLFSMFDGTYGSTFISIVSSVYIGYDNTVPGAIIGGIWGLIDGFIGGYVLAWLYNRFLQG